MEHPTSRETGLTPGAGANGVGGESPFTGSGRDFASAIVAFYRDCDFAVHWTDGKEGDDAKRCRSKWPAKARRLDGNLGSEAGQFATRLKTKNPVVVARNSNLFIIDADSPADVERVEALGLPETLMHESSPGKRHYLFRLPSPDAPHTFVEFSGGKVTAKGNQYIVVSPGTHPDGHRRRFLNKERPIAPISQEDIDRIIGAQSPNGEHDIFGASPGNGGEIRPGHRNNQLHRRAVAKYHDGVPIEQAWHELWDVNEAIRDEHGNPAPLPEEELRALIRSAYSKPPKPPTADGGRPRPRLSEDGMACLFKDTLGDRYRYQPRLKRWLAFGGHMWEDEEGNHHAREDMVQTILTTAARYYADLRADDEIRKAAEKFSKAKHIRNLRDAALNISEGRLLLPLEKLDRDPYLIAFANGVYDLRTGDLRDGKPEDYITVGSKVAFHPDAYSADWEEKFLPSVFEHNDDLIRYMHRLAGLCLSGLTKEEQLWILYGIGRNGKGCYTGTLGTVLGPKLTAYPNFDTLTVSKFNDGSKPTPDIARLRGKRLVVASEKNESKIMDEEKIKRLTGGDTITARFLHENDIEFEPGFKLLLAVNHKPVLNVGDDAIRHRVVLVPFKAQFTRENGTLDKDLKERLRSPENLEGVLAWMVRGWHEYYEQGLPDCSAIESATEEFLAEMNPLAEFVAVTFELGDDFSCSGEQVRLARLAYHDEYPREKRISDSDFTDAMRALGFTKSRDGRRGITWHGLRPKGAVDRGM